MTHPNRIGRIALVALILMAGAAAVYALVAVDGSGKSSLFPGIALARPAFAQESASFLDTEAGMSAYTDVPGGFSLNAAKTAFRIVERETNDWLVGWVEIPGYSQAEDAHVFAHRSGSIVAYYDPGSPVSRTLHWTPDRLTLGSNKLQQALEKVASAVSAPVSTVGFYNFEFPNATEWMLILDTISFSVNLPSQLEVFDRSFTARKWFGGTGYGLTIDGITIVPGGTHNPTFGHISSEILSPDEDHTVAGIGNQRDIAISLLYLP